MATSTEIKPVVLTPTQASKYIGIDTKTDALKASRSTGMLWGVEAPAFIKAGKKKVLYPVKPKNRSSLCNDIKSSTKILLTEQFFSGWGR